MRSDSDLSFLQQSLPRGLQVGMVVLLIYGGIVDGKCMLSLVFFLQTPGSYFPTTRFCHPRHYLPFSALHGLLWRDMSGSGCITAVGCAFSSYQPNANSFSFFLYCWGPEVHIHFSLVLPHLPRHISSLERERKRRLQGFPHQGL